MRKPSFALFERLNSRFLQICRRNELKYQLIPYFISSHPGCGERDMQALASKVLGKLNFTLEQVQDLTPTPMTLSSVMFYMGENPYTGEKVYVARTQDEKRKQKSYFFGGSLPEDREHGRNARGGAPSRSASGTKSRPASGHGGATKRKPTKKW
jgi:radical SAM superfamily enzyme YgiQ (UPF0313 family)